MLIEREGILLDPNAFTFEGILEAVESAFSAISSTISAFTDGGTLSGASALISFGKAFDAIKVKDQPPKLAYLLVLGALARAMELALLESGLSRQPSKAEWKELARTMVSRLTDEQVRLPADFLEHPLPFPFLRLLAEDARRQFEGNIPVKRAGGLDAALQRYFPNALGQVWATRPLEFELLASAMTSPFNSASKREHERQRYLLNIQRAFQEEPLLGQPDEDPVLLREVFVPLRAYWEHREEDSSLKRILVELVENLTLWIEDNHRAARQHHVRVVSGGPGIGKSSSLKDLACRLAISGRAFPVFVPLASLTDEGELPDRVNKYLNRIEAFSPEGGPLGRDIAEFCTLGPIVLIFDGLDELIAEGQARVEITRDFVAEVKSFLRDKNIASEKPRVLAIVSGRVAAAEKAAEVLRVRPEDVLHLLPFTLSRTEMLGFPDKYQLRLNHDQREEWWKRWRGRRQSGPNKIPQQFVTGGLNEVSRDPLLLYFLALVKAWEPRSGRDKATRNEVYRRVLMLFHERELDKNINNFARDFEDYDAAYEPALQAMAMAAWAGKTSRVGLVTDVLRFLDRWDVTSDIKIAVLFRKVVGDHNAAFSASLAFHTRPLRGENTFEFTHKTFAEYLVARRFVTIALDTNPDCDAVLTDWTWHWGVRAVDPDLLQFIRDEFGERTMDRSKREDALDRLRVRFKRGLEDGYPAHDLAGRKNPPSEAPRTFSSMAGWSRNSEEALLVALNATIRLRAPKSERSAAVIRPSAGNLFVFGDMLHRLDRQPDQGFVWKFCMDELDLSNAHLVGAYLFGASLVRVNFSGSDISESTLSAADLSYSNLNSADMRRANLQGTNFSRAFLGGANLTGSNLKGARLNGATIATANLNDANLSDAMLCGSNLTNTNLTGVVATKANFTETNLRRANFRGATLEGSNFTYAEISEANLLGANLRGADLRGAVCRHAVFDGAKFTGANLAGANFGGAALRGANLSGVNLTGTDLKDADLSGSILSENSYLLKVFGLRDAKNLDATWLPLGWVVAWSWQDKRWNITTPNGPYVDPSDRTSKVI